MKKNLVLIECPGRGETEDEKRERERNVNTRKARVVSQIRDGSSVKDGKECVCVCLLVLGLATRSI